MQITHICKPRLKNSYISVDKSANIVLKTPKVSSSYIQKLLTQKENWIQKKLKQIEINPPIVLSLDNIHDAKNLVYLQQRVEFFASIMQLKYSELKFRKMKSRWGSCNSRGTITLNKKLINTPKECIDYVVVHELAHLVYMNHSKKFHLLIDKYICDAKQAKEMLSRVVFI